MLASGEVRVVAILKVSRFWSSPQLARASAPAEALAVPASPSDGLDAFRSETDDPEPAALAPVAAPKPSAVAKPFPIQLAWLLPALRWAVVVAVSAGLGAAALYGYQRRFSSRPVDGTVTVLTEPSGLDVTLAGKSLGKTPLTATLHAGAYELEIGSAGTARKIPVNVTAGSSLVHQIAFTAGPEPVAATTGGVRIQTEPAHLAISIDGVARGVSPISLDGLQPGNHEVSVRTTPGS